mmetsp:Transcript_54370/g.65571  ORF Transcript_54370/g.65571 Transcript_54370/m.65571 type:complete len:343 (-) Transcript_54370:14-1042(-)
MPSHEQPEMDECRYDHDFTFVMSSCPLRNEKVERLTPVPWKPFRKRFRDCGLRACHYQRSGSIRLQKSFNFSKMILVISALAIIRLNAVPSAQSFSLSYPLHRAHYLFSKTIRQPANNEKRMTHFRMSKVAEQTTATVAATTPMSEKESTVLTTDNRCDAILKEATSDDDNDVNAMTPQQSSRLPTRKNTSKSQRKRKRGSRKRDSITNRVADSVLSVVRKTLQTQDELRQSSQSTSSMTTTTTSPPRFRYPGSIEELLLREEEELAKPLPPEKRSPSPLVPPHPGTILLPDTFRQSDDGNKNQTISSLISIRTARRADDDTIASLRLSVFSNFSKTEKSQF